MNQTITVSYINKYQQAIFLKKLKASNGFALAMNHVQTANFSL